ncbi:MAG: hypothetical protein ACK40K_07260 [Raineya sp.]
MNDLNKKLPFTNPENYFEDFSERLQKRIDGETEPKGVSRKLPFAVPEKYFDLLPQRIMKRIASLRKKVWYKEKTTWQWAVATCSFVFLVWFGQNIWFGSDTKKQAETELIGELKKINKEEIEEYLVANYTKISVLDELPKNVIEIKKDFQQEEKLKDTLFHNLPKETLEEMIPENMLEEILETEFDEQSNESIFLETDTI